MCFNAYMFVRWIAVTFKDEKIATAEFCGICLSMVGTISKAVGGIRYSSSVCFLSGGLCMRPLVRTKEFSPELMFSDIKDSKASYFLDFAFEWLTSADLFCLRGIICFSFCHGHKSVHFVLLILSCRNKWLYKCKTTKVKHHAYLLLSGGSDSFHFSSTASMPTSRDMSQSLRTTAQSPHLLFL